MGQEERVLPYEKNTGLDDVQGHGQFVHDYLNFNRLDYEILLTSGASTLSKAMSLSREDLESLIEECRNELTNEQIKTRIESIRVPDLELVCDGTYMKGLNNEHLLNIYISKRFMKQFIISVSDSRRSHLKSRNKNKHGPPRKENHCIRSTFILPPEAL